MDNYENFDGVCIPWSGWKIVRRLGKGGFGEVYLIQRNVFGNVEEAAMKIIHIPQDESEVETFRDYGMDDKTLKQSYENEVQRCMGEYRLMLEFKGQTNIVSCEDFAAIPRKDGIGADIYIRMEYLTPLKDQMKQAPLSTEEVIRLGKDVCRALILCQKKNIIHRDIKPENIMVSKFGDYKLGDFGIARALAHTTRATKAGTKVYMAPEICKDQPYGKEVDIYSLGLVLYELLNNRKLPFWPMDRVPSYQDAMQAQNRVVRGDKFPEPVNGSPALKAIVMKACAYDPKDRFQSAQEMYQALEHLGGGFGSGVYQDASYATRRGNEQVANGFSHSVPREPEILCVGVELGAMYTRVATYDFTQKQGKLLLEIPSLIGRTSDGGILIGEECKNQLLEDPQSVYRFHDFLFGYRREVRLRKGGKSYSYDLLVAAYLKDIRKLIEEKYNCKCLIGCICYPQTLPVKYREDLREACQIAGVGSVEEEKTSHWKFRLHTPGLMNAMSYFWERDRQESGNFVICDIGYGSADISVIDYENEVFEELAADGSEICTGRGLQEQILEKLYNKYPILLKPLPGKRNYEELLKYSIEVSMPYFSHKETVRIPLPQTADPSISALHEVVLEKAELEELVQDEAKKLGHRIRRCIADGNLKPGEISRIFVTGQITGFPQVEKELSRILEKEVTILTDPGHTAVMGTALYSCYLNGFGENQKKPIMPLKYESEGYMLWDNLGGHYRAIEPGMILPCKKTVYITLPEDLEEWTCTLAAGNNVHPMYNASLMNCKLSKESIWKRQNQMVVVVELGVDGKVEIHLE